MEFRLVYLGQHLKSAGRANPRAWEKHQIRLYLHEQLKRLWETHPLLKFYAQDAHFERGDLALFPVSHQATKIEFIAKRYEGFVPVAIGDFGMSCELDILFLRAEPVGKVISRDAAGGDLDNRLKVLLDALCIPARGGVIHRQDDPPDPTPIFVLLSDDSIVTSLRVTADRLLTTETDDPSEACLIIHANIKVIDAPSSPYGIGV